jgi:hypothetical protein
MRRTKRGESASGGELRIDACSESDSVVTGGSEEHVWRVG